MLGVGLKAKAKYKGGERRLACSATRENKGDFQNVFLECSVKYEIYIDFSLTVLRISLPGCIVKASIFRASKQ